MTDPDESLATDLAGLSLPAPSAMRLGYAAGLAAGHRRATAWRWATAAAATVAVAVSVRRPAPSPVFVDRVVYVRPIAPAVTIPPVPRPDPSSLLSLRAAVRSDGSLPFPTTTGSGVQQPVMGAWMSEPPDAIE